MTGYELSRAWFDWSFENPDINTPTHTALYLWCVEKWNRVGQKDKFSISSSEAMEAIGVKSYNTYKRVFDDLVGIGFLNLIQESKNQYTCNIIELSKFDTSLYKALDKANTTHTTKQSESTQQSNDSRYNNKQRNKETKKQDNYTSDFESFWLIYNKPRGKHKSFQLWQKLTQADKDKIMPHVEFYKKVQPDAKFRKDPERYFTNRLWDDFEPNKIPDVVAARPKREMVY